MKSRRHSITDHIRNWFVASTAALMAIAWTVSSLVTPGVADPAGITPPAGVTVHKKALGKTITPVVVGKYKQKRPATDTFKDEEALRAAQLMAPPTAEEIAGTATRTWNRYQDGTPIVWQYHGTQSKGYWLPQGQDKHNLKKIHIPGFAFIEGTTGVKDYAFRIPYHTEKWHVINPVHNDGMIELCAYCTSVDSGSWQKVKAGAGGSTVEISADDNGHKPNLPPNHTSFCIEPGYTGYPGEFGYTKDLSYPDNHPIDGYSSTKNKQDLLAALATLSGESFIDEEGKNRPIGKDILQRAIWWAVWGEKTELSWTYTGNSEPHATPGNIKKLIELAEARAKDVQTAQTMLNKVTIQSWQESRTADTVTFGVKLDNGNTKASKPFFNLDNLIVTINGQEYSADAVMKGVRVTVPSSQCGMDGKALQVKFSGFIDVPAIFINGGGNYNQNLISKGGRATVEGSESLDCESNGELYVKKDVQGLTPQPAKDFALNVTCGDSEPIQVQVSSDGTPVKVGDYPVGTECSVEEQTSGAEIDGYRFEGVSYSGGNVTDAPQKVKIEAAETAYTMTVTNTYVPNESDFKVTKRLKVDGEAVPSATVPEGGDQWQFQYRCKTDGTFGDWADLSPAIDANGSTNASPKMKVGTVCQVKETSKTVAGYSAAPVQWSGANGHAATDPADAWEFTVADGETAEITATNELTQRKGTFSITKAFAQNSSYQGGEGHEYAFDVTCDGQAVEGVSVNDTDNKTWTSPTQYPVGTTCLIKEKTESQGDIGNNKFTGVSYTGGTASGSDGQLITITDGETPVTVTATNNYQLKTGTVAVKKVVSGGPADLQKSFSITAVCGDDTVTKEVPANGQAVVIGTYPLGTQCLFSEDNATTAIDGYTHSGVEFSGGNDEEDSAKVTVTEADTTVTMTATNTYQRKVGKFTLTKAFGPQSSYQGGQNHTYRFAIDCDQDPVEGDALTEATITDKGSFTSPSYPVGTKCQVSEDIASAYLSDHQFAGVTYKGGKGTVVSEDHSSIEVTIKDQAEPVKLTATNNYIERKLKTTASTKDKNVLKQGVRLELIDTVEVKGLEKGKTYTVGGWFVNKEGSTPVTGFAKTTFTVDDSFTKDEKTGLYSGKVTISDPTNWAPTPESNEDVYVAFEYLWEGNGPDNVTPGQPFEEGEEPVVKHENPDDPAQTVSSKMGKFTLTKKVADPAPEGVSADPEFEFKVTCDGEELDPVKVKKDQTWTSDPMPATTECSIEEVGPLHVEKGTLSQTTYQVTPADAVKAESNNQTIVIKEGEEAQVKVEVTNTFTTPTVETTVEDKAVAEEGKAVTVVDKVDYTNLIAGKEYTVVGQLKYQDGSAAGTVVPGVEAGEGCTVQGERIPDQDCETLAGDKVGLTFTAPGEPGTLVNGYVNLVFEVPATSVTDKPMVVFEDVKHGTVTVGTHHDINDEKQTKPVKAKVAFPIKKILEGDALTVGQFANGTYNFSAQCGTDPSAADAQKLSVTLKDGAARVTSDKVEAFVGDTCIITEAAVNTGEKYASTVSFNAGSLEGASVNSAGDTLTVVISDANKDALNAEEFAFEATNTVTVNNGTFQVKKEAVTPSTDADLADKTFQFRYRCDGDDDWTTLPALSAGQSSAEITKPHGTVCTVEELDAAVTHKTLQTTWEGTTVNDSGAQQFTVDKDTKVVAKATNAYTHKTGGFDLRKTLSASEASGLQGSSFVLHYECQYGDEDPVAQDVAVPSNAKAPTQVNGIKLGSTCRVTEPQPASTSQTLHTLSWKKDGQALASAPSFRVNDEKVRVEIEATNTYVDKASGFAISKAFGGDAVHQPESSEAFTFSYDCTDSNTKQQVKGQFTVTSATPWQSSQGSQELKDLAAGSQCTIKEVAPTSAPADATWSKVTFSSTGAYTDLPKGENGITFSVPEGTTPIEFTATNHYVQDKGSVAVTKQTDGDVSADKLPSNYTFTISCLDANKNMIDIKAPDATKTITSSQTATWTGLPVGAQCTVREQNPGSVNQASHALTWSGAGTVNETDNSVTLTVTKDATATAIATNTYNYERGSFSIQKRSAALSGTVPAGQTAPTLPTEFTFTYQCGQADPVDVTVQPQGKAHTVEGLVAGTTCTITEKADAPSVGPRITTWMVDGKASTGASQQITIGNNTNVAVVVDNEYPQGPHIGTSLAGPDGKDIVITGDNITVKDTVSYTNLDTSKTYVLTGELHAVGEDGTVTATGITSEPVEFTPEQSQGTQVVTFTVASSVLVDHPKLVAYEKLRIKGEEEPEATHEDPNDESQIVKTHPSIGTTLTQDGKKTYPRPVDSDGTVTFVDSVKVTNARVGHKYRLSARLYGDKALTGVTAISDEFTVSPQNPGDEFGSTTVEVTFTVPATVLQHNARLVAFEKLWKAEDIEPVKPGDKTVTPKPEKKPVASHEDENDPSQTVKSEPSVSTKASVDDNGQAVQSKTIALNGKRDQTETLTDTMTWYSLEPGDYVACASMNSPESQAAITDEVCDGSQAFSVAKGQTQGEVSVTMDLTLTDLKPGRDHAIVLFEKVYRASDTSDGMPHEDATPVAEHTDINDGNQTIRIVFTPPLPPRDYLSITKGVDDTSKEPLSPETLYGFEFGCTSVDGMEDVPMTRFVLKAGQTKSDGFPTNYLGHDCTITEVGPVQGEWSESDGWQLQKLGNRLWSDARWIHNGEAKEGVAPANPVEGAPAHAAYTFHADDSLTGDKIVVNVINAITDKPDEPGEDQPDTPVPSIGTSASDPVNNTPGPDGVDRSIEPGLQQTVIDTVTYTNFKINTEYTMKGTLHKKGPSGDEGVVTEAIAGMGCLVDGKQIEGVECVNEGNGVVSLKFSVNKPAENGYASGTVTLAFVLPGEVVREGSEFVAFESAESSVGVVAQHQDINDPKQTIEVSKPICPPEAPTPDLPEKPEKPSHPGEDQPNKPGCPRVSTTATDTVGDTVDKTTQLDQSVYAGKDAVIADLITYSQLRPETEYTVKGRLHEKAGEGVDGGIITTVKAGEHCMADGHAATCVDEGNGIIAVTFTTPAAPEGMDYVDGNVIMEFKVPGSAVHEGAKMVAFETMIHDGKIVASHHDIDSPSQTINHVVPQSPGPQPPTVINPSQPSTVIPGVLAKTGTTTFIVMLLGLMALISGGILVSTTSARRRIREESDYQG